MVRLYARAERRCRVHDRSDRPRRVEHPLPWAELCRPPLAAPRPGHPRRPRASLRPAKAAGTPRGRRDLHHRSTFRKPIAPAAPGLGTPSVWLAALLGSALVRARHCAGADSGQLVPALLGAVRPEKDPTSRRGRGHKGSVWGWVAFLLA